MAAKTAKLWHRHKRHLITLHIGAGLALLIVFLLGAFAGAAGLKTIAGTNLDQKAQGIYQALKAGHVEQGEQLPPARAKALEDENQKAALAGTTGPNHPVPLATPEPATITSLVQNYSSRNGARPALLVVHDTESPNTPGSLAGAWAIRAWFNNPASQASSNFTTDCAGNTILMVPDTAKAWTQAGFNSWAISDELIGHASQTRAEWLKCDTQLRAAAKLFAAEASKWGIPVQLGAVSGCTITRAGIVDHKMLGACGGGHHDNGPNFPMAYFISLVKQYQHAGFHPKPTPHPHPKPVLATCTAKHVQVALNTRGARPRLVVDGVLGTHTRQAVKAFQRTHHLATSGVVGSATGRALGLGGCK